MYWSSSVVRCPTFSAGRKKVCEKWDRKWWLSKCKLLRTMTFCDYLILIRGNAYRQGLKCYGLFRWLGVFSAL
jgi:hypothetical protein